MVTLELTDSELGILCDIVRQHKITITNDDLVMLITGKKATPLAELTMKLIHSLSTRQKELLHEEKANTEISN